MTARYAYLSVAPRECDVVLFPDGAETVLPRGEGARHAAEWTPGAAGPEAAGREQRRARQQDALADWQRRLDEALDDSMSITHGRMIRETFEAENPKPQLDDDPADVQALKSPRVSSGRWWCARLEGADESFEAWLDESGVPLPRALLARALNDLARRSWMVRQLSEDRRAVHDGDSSYSEVVGAWFLLERA